MFSGEPQANCTWNLLRSRIISWFECEGCPDDIYYFIWFNKWSDTKSYFIFNKDCVQTQDGNQWIQINETLE